MLGLVYMLDYGSSFNLCPRNYSILTQRNTYNSVAYLNSGVVRGFPVSLLSASVISTTDEIPELFHSQCFHCIFLLLNFLLGSSVNYLPSLIRTENIDSVFIL